MADGETVGRPIPDFEPLFVGGRERVVRPGESVIAPATEPGEVYLIRAGRVRVCRTSADGREITLAVVGPGEIIGEVALLDGGERTAMAMAQSEVKLVALDRGQFLQAIASRPENALRLIVSLCKRLREADQMVEELIFLGVKERLRSLFERLNERGDAALLADLTHQKMAEMIGATRESVTRALAELRRAADEPCPPRS